MAKKQAARIGKRTPHHTEIMNLIEAYCHWTVQQERHRAGNRNAIGHNAEDSRICERKSNSFRDLHELIRTVLREHAAARKEIRRMRASFQLGELMVENRQLISAALREYAGKQPTPLLGPLEMLLTGVEGG